MASIYLCSLGLGMKQKDGGYKYSPAVYGLNEKKSSETEFVQAAEMEILGAENFDKIVVVATNRSYDTHFVNLEKQLIQHGTQNIIPLMIEEDMSSAGQWKWFEQILQHIGVGDELTVDLTHGYRMVPIVFSTAINFLQRARKIFLRAVYYGVFEKIKDIGYAPIEDMRDFYVINEWAEAVSRLVEDADTKKITELAKKTSGYQLNELDDKGLVDSLNELTDSIRNVEVNRIAERSAYAVKHINEGDKRATLTGKILLGLLRDKFGALASKGTATGEYDKYYFQSQIEIIHTLLEHKLYMQAFTAMRELIGSMGMIRIPKARVNNQAGRKRRRRFADAFVNMFQFEENEWKFGVDAARSVPREPDKKDIDFDSLKPFYNMLKQIGVEPVLRGFTKEMVECRNGFDHAWTQKSEAIADVASKGVAFFEKIKKAVYILEQNGILK